MAGRSALLELRLPHAIGLQILCSFLLQLHNEEAVLFLLTMIGGGEEEQRGGDST
jgi:hypothetical protein